MKKAWLLVGAIGLAVAVPAGATLQISKKEKGAPCTTCHVKMGSKELNAAGKYYAQHRTLAGSAPEKPAAPAKPAPAPQPTPPTPPAKPAEAATPAPPTPAANARQLYLIIRETPYLEKQQAYQQMFKEWVAAAQEVKLSEEFAWEVVQKGPLNYSFIIPLKEMAELDPASEAGQARHRKMAAAFGEQRFQELVARTHGTFEAAELFVVESVPELSCTPPSGSPAAGAPDSGAEAKRPRFVHVDVTRVRFDRSEAYLAVMKKYFEIGRRAGCPFVTATYRTLTGPANTYFIVIEAADWKQLAELHRFLEEEFPKAAESPEVLEKLNADWASSVVSFEHYEETVRYDLSYRPSAAVAPQGKPAPEKK